MRRIPSARTTAALAALTLCAGWVEAGSGAAATVPAAHPEARGCITVPNLTEDTTITYQNPGAADTHQGETGVTHAVISYPDGRQFAVEDGTFVVFIDGAGTLSEMFQFTDTLEGGTTYGGGVIPLVATGEGLPQKFTDVGTSGRYRGMTGEWDFTLTSHPSPTQSVFAVSLHLCR
jgi:hypothetical protein